MFTLYTRARENRVSKRLAVLEWLKLKFIKNRNFLCNKAGKKMCKKRKELALFRRTLSYGLSFNKF